MGALKALFTNLSVRVDVLVVSSLLHTQDGRTSEVMGTTTALVFSDFVKDTDDPLVVFHDAEAEGESGKKIFAFWKLNVFLSTYSSQPPRKIPN